LDCTILYPRRENFNIDGSSSHSHTLSLQNVSQSSAYGLLGCDTVIFEVDTDVSGELAVFIIRVEVCSVRNRLSLYRQIVRKLVTQTHWERVRKWSLIWTSGNGAQKRPCCRVHSVFPYQKKSVRENSPF
jgi:hypothetical protein